jgi:hypothetical protein
MRDDACFGVGGVGEFFIGSIAFVVCGRVKYGSVATWICEEDNEVCW